MEEKPALRLSLLEDECMLDKDSPGLTVVMDGEFVLEQQLCSNRLPMRPMSSDDAFEQEGATMVHIISGRAQSHRVSEKRGAEKVNNKKELLGDNLHTLALSLIDLLSSLTSSLISSTSRHYFLYPP